MLMIGNGRLVTRDAEQPFFENGAVVIDGTTVKKVGDLETLKKSSLTPSLLTQRGASSCRLSLIPMSISTAPWQEALALTDMIQKDF